MSHLQTLNVKATRLVLTSTHQQCSALVAQWEQMKPVTSAVFAQTEGNKNVPLVRSPPCVCVWGLVHGDIYLQHGSQEGKTIQQVSTLCSLRCFSP